MTEKEFIAEFIRYHELKEAENVKPENLDEWTTNAQSTLISNYSQEAGISFDDAETIILRHIWW